MDYFQSAVTEYLRASRSVFVNTECRIQLDPGDVHAKDRHWYCDAVAVDFRKSTVYLCEITYSTTMHSLFARLQRWEEHWAELRTAVFRDCGIPEDWQVRPWVFIPEQYDPVFKKKTALLKPTAGTSIHMPEPLVTYLESVLPWKYRIHSRGSDALARVPEPPD
jgi:hypothetical protein